KLLPDGGSLKWDELKPFISRLQDAVARAKHLGEVNRDEDARPLWNEIYEKLSVPSAGIIGAITSRAEAQVLRLSLLYALLEQSSEVRRPHLQAALALWQYCSDSVRYIFGDLLGDPDADALLHAL